jgi:hypothetical protein
MTTPQRASRQAYLEWVEEQIEEYKTTLTHDELLDLAEAAIARLHASDEAQYTLTELLLCDAVDGLVFERLKLPDYRRWRRACRSDTVRRPPEGTSQALRVAS